MNLYHYDHCPYCVRVRIFAGWKGIELQEKILLNADEQSHIDLAGVKMTPILQLDDGRILLESLDIVAYLDQLQEARLLTDSPSDYSASNSELGACLDRLRAIASYLSYPRCIRLKLPEFARPEDISYFQNKKTKIIGAFDLALRQTASYIKQLNPELEKLEKLLENTDASYANILVFPLLRNLTMVKELSFSPKLTSYIEKIAEKTGVASYSSIAVSA